VKKFLSNEAIFTIALAAVLIAIIIADPSLPRDILGK
jgi:hypothetical protein